MDIPYFDYRRIYKELGLTPKQWNRLQKIESGEIKNHGFEIKHHEAKIEIYKCSCRSVWCKKCAKMSPTNKTISERLSGMDWRKVRHVILTVNRDKDPAESFDIIRSKKAITRLITRLNRLKGRVLGRYLWVLEFHRGGFPHWHLLVESEGGMIGKTAIQDKWEHGLVWESYIQNTSHWGAIKGYHKKKGYLAGENKAHQIELPGYLMGESRVRKFGCNFKTGIVPRGTIHSADTNNINSITPDAEHKIAHKPRNKSRSYTERFKACDKASKACINDSMWVNLDFPADVAKRYLAEYGDRIDYKTFHTPVRAYLDMVEAMSMEVPDREPETKGNSQ